MKLQLVGSQTVWQKGDWRYMKIFETPNGTQVAKLKGGYYPVGRGGHVRMNRKYIGRVKDRKSVV